MKQKKHTVKEFNQKCLPDWKDIKAIIPQFEEWTFGDEDDSHTEKIISNIDIIFEDGTKLSIFPFSNRDGMDEELLQGLKIAEYRGQEIEFV